MLQSPFSATDFTTLNNGQDISASVPANGMRGFLIQNITPYAFFIYDDIGTCIAFIAPWQIATGSITQSTQELHIKSDKSSASVQVAGITVDQWKYSYEFSINEQPTQVVPLPYANAANNNTIVANPSTQAVPTQNQSYYGDSSDGAFNPFGAYPSLKISDLTFTTTNSYTDNGDGSLTGATVAAQFRGAPNFQVKKRFKFSTTVANDAYVMLRPTHGNAPANSDYYQLRWQSDNNIALWQNINNTATAITNANATGYGTPAPIVGDIYEFTLTLWSHASTIDISVSVDNITTGANVWKATANPNSYVQPWQFIEEFGTGTSNTTCYYSDFYPLYLYNNNANEADIHNYTSISIPSNAVIGWANPAKYAVFFSQGDMTVNGTLYAPPGMPGASTSSPQIKLFQGTITVPIGGAGGKGGDGVQANPNQAAAGKGGAGGAASPYGSGCGGGGAGGNAGWQTLTGAQSGGGGGGGSTGYGDTGGNGSNGAVGSGVGGGGTGTAGSDGYGSGGTPGQGGTGVNGGGNGTNGLSTPSKHSGTLILLINGNVTIGSNGLIDASGSDGAAGGIGGNQGTANQNAGGCGGSGSGGNGGGVVLCYAAKKIINQGTVNVNGGQGGAGGSGTQGGANGLQGQAGQAGVFSTFQYNQAVGA